MEIDMLKKPMAIVNDSYDSLLKTKSLLLDFFTLLGKIKRNKARLQRMQTEQRHADPELGHERISVFENVKSIERKIALETDQLFKLRDALIETKIPGLAIDITTVLYFF